MVRVSSDGSLTASRRSGRALEFPRRSARRRFSSAFEAAPESASAFAARSAAFWETLRDVSLSRHWLWGMLGSGRFALSLASPGPADRVVALTALVRRTLPRVYFHFLISGEQTRAFSVPCAGHLLILVGGVWNRPPGKVRK